MPKDRIHREWFRPVHTRAIKVKRLSLPLADFLCTKCHQVSTRAIQHVKEGHRCQQGTYSFCNGDFDPTPLCEPFQNEYQGFAGYESSRKSCPTCKSKLEIDEFVWSWGEYKSAKWHTVQHFCKSCFEQHVQLPLTAHAVGCGCKIELVAKGCSLPKWLCLPSTCSVS